MGLDAYNTVSFARHLKPLRIDNEALREIRQNTDWRGLFGALKIQKDEQKSRENDWWGRSPFSPEERTASFHINSEGWYCFSTSQGGGPIELVQRIFRLNCYEAGRWLLDSGISSIQEETRADAAAAIVPSPPPLIEVAAKAPEGNQPIRQDLRPLLSPHHPEFALRGIPSEILQELGIGYLERPSKGTRPDPLNRRLVFQVRGLEEKDGRTQPVILTHTGRATTPAQEAEHGKWWMYPGFKKRFEIYNLDRAVLDEEAERQAARTGHVLVVEGSFDVAKLYAAGIRNVVATFGAHLHPDQLPRFDVLANLLGIERFLLLYDRDQASANPEKQGFRQATEVLCRAGYQVEAFDWNRRFSSPRRRAVSIPETIGDPCEFSLEQLAWLREQGQI